MTGQATNLTYDYEDRIATISGTGIPTNQFTYNALDARVEKVDSAGTSTYLRDGEDPTDAVLSDGTASYVPGISRHTSAGTRTYHQNFIGSNAAETDGSGVVQATRSHDAFGNVTSTTGTPSGLFGYAGGFGYQEDDDSGLLLLGHRYYDSTTGRFITRDPAEVGDNWYAYCENEPLSYYDDDDSSKKPARAPNSKRNRRAGPSGKPRIDVVRHPSRGRAEEAARRESAKGQAPVHHPGHFHPRGANGEKLPTHHEYPPYRCIMPPFLPGPRLSPGLNPRPTPVAQGPGWRRGARGAGAAAAALGFGYAAREFGKWAAAVALIPESAGGSLIVAGALP